jgi:hypothetical protein
MLIINLIKDSTAKYKVLLLFTTYQLTKPLSTVRNYCCASATTAWFVSFSPSAAKNLISVCFNNTSLIPHFRIICDPAIYSVK